MSLDLGEHGRVRERRGKLFRYPSARPPVQTEVAEGKVRFTAPNGENYEVDLVNMRQRNLRTGNLRSVSCSGGSSSSTAWFFDKNAKAVEKNSTARHRWLPYSRPLQRLLEEAARRQLQLPEAPEAEADAEDEVEKVVEVVEVVEADVVPLLSAPEQLSFAEVRQAAFAGACSRVQQLLCRGIQALGEEIFDRRYPGFVLGREHKCCIKMLLAPGAKLGRFAPNSKLLRKVDSDCLDLWATCFLRSASLAGYDLPETVQQIVSGFR